MTSSSCVLPQCPQFLSINAARVLGGGQEGGGVDQMKGNLLQNRPQVNSSLAASAQPSANDPF